MKKALIFYYDLQDVFDMLTDEEAGRLIKAVFNYEINGEVADFDDRMMKSTYKRITDNLDRNKIKYEEMCERRKEAALKRWEKTEKSLQQ